MAPERHVPHALRKMHVGGAEGIPEVVYQSWTGHAILPLGNGHLSDHGVVVHDEHETRPGECFADRAAGRQAERPNLLVRDDAVVATILGLWKLLAERGEHWFGHRAAEIVGRGP